MSERMKNRDDSSYVWAVLDALDFADFGQLSPAEQSLVLVRAAQIQQTDYRGTQISGFHRQRNTNQGGKQNGNRKEKQRTCNRLSDEFSYGLYR